MTQSENDSNISHKSLIIDLTLQEDMVNCQRTHFSQRKTQKKAKLPSQAQAKQTYVLIALRSLKVTALDTLAFVMSQEWTILRNLFLQEQEQCLPKM